MPGEWTEAEFERLSRGVQEAIAAGNFRRAFRMLVDAAGPSGSEPSGAHEDLRVELESHCRSVDLFLHRLGDAIPDRNELDHEATRLAFVAIELVEVLRRQILPRSRTEGASLRYRISLAVSERDGIGVKKPEVFISYCHEDYRLADALQLALSSRGFAVWYDQNLNGGDRFESVINAQIDDARALIGLWTSNSMQSQWVKHESVRAHLQGKLIPVRHRALDVETIPPEWPTNVHILQFGDDDGVVRSLTKLGCSQSPTPA